MQDAIKKQQAVSDEKTIAIVRAARETFLARGFDAASMDQIALSAGVSKRTVYNRFRSKEELFAGAIMDTCKDLLAGDAAAIESTLPPREFIRALSIQFITELLKPEAISLRRIAAFEAERTPAIGQAYMENGPQWMVEHCRPILDRLHDKGFLKIENSHEAIWRLGALITEPLHTRVLMGETPKDLGAAIAAQVDGGIDAFMKIYGA